MVVFGPDRTVVSANRAYCRFLGSAHDELLRSSVSDFGHPDDGEATERMSLVVQQRSATVFRLPASGRGLTRSCSR